MNNTRMPTAMSFESKPIRLAIAAAASLNVGQKTNPYPMASSRTENALIMIVGLPVLGVLMGGIYSLPAMKVTDERDPWLTILLGGGLAITVFGIGFLTGTPASWSTALFGFGLILVLAARLLYGSLGHNIERFGLVHMLVLMLTLILAALANAKKDKPNKAALLTPAPLRVQSAMAVQPSTYCRGLAQGQV